MGHEIDGVEHPDECECEPCWEIETRHEASCKCDECEDEREQATFDKYESEGLPKEHNRYSFAVSVEGPDEDGFTYLHIIPTDCRSWDRGLNDDVSFGEEFDEVCESEFAYEGKTEDAKAKLVALGLTFNPNLLSSD